jgi:hypothetical protein
MSENMFTRFLMIGVTFSVLIHVEFWKRFSWDDTFKTGMSGYVRLMD